jgi:D-glycero-alpha-D-manno-heptose-7-phosphate kinase
MFLGISPVRLSFAGGGTDMPEYYEKYGGKVITTTITRFIYVITSPRHDNSFQAFSSDLQSHHEPTSYDNLEPKYGTEIAVSVVKFLNYKEGANFLMSSDVPPGSGLGASGSLAVNLVNTISSLKGEEWTKDKIADTAYHVGRHILNWPIGKQDEYSTAFGGFNFIEFQENKVKVIPMKTNKSALLELQHNLLLFFVGKTRNSETILSSQIQNTKNSNPDTINSLHLVKELAETMHDALSADDLTKFGEILHKSWIAKKKFAINVSNESIDKAYDIAMKHGALGGKLTGAGGGGHLLLYCEPSKQQDVINQMEKLGYKKITFGFYNEGPKMINLYDFARG